MRIPRISLKRTTPIGRWYYGLFAVTALDAFFGVERGIDRIFSLAFFILFALAWPVFTAKRLFDLRHSWLWIFPISVPLLLALLLVGRHQEIALRIVLDVGFLAQLPLFLMSAPKESAAIPPEGSSQCNS
jgi:uncharacterized membrane protein YhaH (DUF805 family)